MFVAVLVIMLIREGHVYLFHPFASELIPMDNASRASKDIGSLWDNAYQISSIVKPLTLRMGCVKLAFKDTTSQQKEIVNYFLAPVQQHYRQEPALPVDQISH